MKMIRLFAIVLAAMALAGCFPRKPEVQTPPATPTVNTVYETKYIVVAPEDAMLRRVPSLPPPDRTYWISLAAPTKANWDAKEKLLTDLYIRQTGSVNQCNATLDEVKKWRDKQLEVYKNK